MVSPFLFAELFRIHLLQQGQRLLFVVVIDHRVDAGEFLHGGTVVLAPRYHEGENCNKWNKDILDVYHSIELFVSDCTAIHHL